MTSSSSCSIRVSSPRQRIMYSKRARGKRITRRRAAQEDNHDSPPRPPDGAPEGGGRGLNEKETRAVDDIKREILTVAALTDRGQQLYKEPVYGLDAYGSGREKDVRKKVDELRAMQSEVSVSSVNGNWELIFATKQLFRASPFFMAIAESMEGSTWHAPWSSPDTAVPSADLFFRLHELQVMSWGASTVGRVTQTIDVDQRTLSSTFDTILFRLTVIPIVGWFKLLPTFGGRVSSFAEKLDIQPAEDGGGKLKMRFELDKTRVDKTEGIPTPPFFLAWLLGVEFPVNAVWKLLPWNADSPMCTSYTTYCDADFRVSEDSNGELFIYTRIMADDADT